MDSGSRMLIRFALGGSNGERVSSPIPGGHIWTEIVFIVLRNHNYIPLFAGRIGIRYGFFSIIIAIQ